MSWILGRRRAVETAHKVIAAVPRLEARCIAHESVARLSKSYSDMSRNSRYIVLCNSCKSALSNNNVPQTTRASYRLYDLKEQRACGDWVDTSRDADTFDTATDSVLIFYGLRVFDADEGGLVQRYLGSEYVNEDRGRRYSLDPLPEGGYSVVLRQRYSARAKQWVDVDSSGHMPRAARKRW